MKRKLFKECKEGCIIPVGLSRTLVNGAPNVYHLHIKVLDHHIRFRFRWNKAFAVHHYTEADLRREEAMWGVTKDV